MLLGLSLSAFTTLHVVIALLGIVAGAAVMADMLRGRLAGPATAIFLATTVATSLTGYLFPADRLLPSHVVGAVSLVALAVALYALYGRQLAGGWRAAYVVTATLALYLNVFVGVVQAFQKVAALKALAPTQSEPPFVIVQFAVLLLFLALGFLALRRFRATAALPA